MKAGGRNIYFLSSKSTALKRRGKTALPPPATHTYSSYYHQPDISLDKFMMNASCDITLTLAR